MRPMTRAVLVACAFLTIVIACESRHVDVNFGTDAGADFDAPAHEVRTDGDSEADGGADAATGKAGGSASFRSRAALVLACGGPPAPPEGMARLVVECCQLVGGTPSEPDCRANRALDAAAVIVDGAERGTCANWRRKGAILSTGRHVIQVRVPLDAPLEEGDCCVDAGARQPPRRRDPRRAV